MSSFTILTIKNSQGGHNKVRTDIRVRKKYSMFFTFVFIVG